jgi:hypothetical protein
MHREKGLAQGVDAIVGRFDEQQLLESLSIAPFQRYTE